MDAERVMNTFLDLVRLDCPSGHEAAAAQYCVKRLRACGCEVEVDDAGEKVGSDTGNVYAVLPGNGSGGCSLVMSAHLDCVPPCEGVDPVVVDGIVRSAGDTVLGADDKVGVAAILEAVQSLVESGEPHATLKIIFTIQEETGCKGAKNLSLGLFGACEPCFVFDMDGEPGTAVIGAPYHYTFDATFAGKASHAGVAPDDGISAIAAAAKAIDLMRERDCLGSLGENSAANVGTIIGGQADNIVPSGCKVTGECRSVNKKVVEAARTAMQWALEDGAEALGAHVDVDWTLEYVGFNLCESDWTVRLFGEAVESLGLEPRLAVSAGGSDANVFANYGMAPIVVGTGMTAFHSLDEHIRVRDIETTARIAEAIARVAADKPSMGC